MHEPAGAWSPPDTAVARPRSVAAMSGVRVYAEKQRFWLDPIGYVSEVHRAHGAAHAFGTRRPEYLFAFHPELNRQVSEDGALFHWAANRKWTGTQGPVSILRASVSNMDGEAYR